jgi:endonuclease/exonuclease/phosphatase family metal-dependent hydrolase
LTFFQLPLQTTLRVATHNIHKGLSALNRRVVIHSLREELAALDADIVFLQEVAGRHDRHARRHGDWPHEPQHEFLAGGGYTASVYGRNRVHRAGEHGNAILSRHPVLRWENEDISAHRFEGRGILHAEIAVPGWSRNLHVMCVHLTLTARGRGRQLEWLRQRVEREAPVDAPLIVAGDFNDWYWRHRATHEFAHPLNMHEVFESGEGRPAKSYPAIFPLLRLDRIYVRGLTVRQARVQRPRRAVFSSDHRALACELEVPLANAA